MDILVSHDKENQRFWVVVEGEESSLKYYLNDDTIDLASTYVPPALRGFGIAQKLVEEALKFAADNNLKIIPSCWYVEGYMKKNNLI